MRATRIDPVRANPTHLCPGEHFGYGRPVWLIWLPSATEN